MRTVFLFLVMANLIFFAWTLGYFGEGPSGREPQRMSSQLHPEAIHLLREPPPPAPVSVTCKRLSGFDSPLAAEALKIELGAALGEKGDWTFTLLTTAAATEYWVGIPALATAALAEKKKAELVAAKFTDLKLIEEAAGPTGGPFVILIAKFVDEASAKRYLTSQSKTLRTARVLPREREAKTTLDISGPTKDFESRTKDLLAPHNLVAEACGAGDGTR